MAHKEVKKQPLTFIEPSMKVRGFLFKTMKTMETGYSQVHLTCASPHPLHLGMQ